LDISILEILQIMTPIKRLLSIKNTSPSQKLLNFAGTNPRTGFAPFYRLRPDFEKYWLRMLKELLLEAKES